MAYVIFQFQPEIRVSFQSVQSSTYLIEVFTNSSEYRNANIANFVLAVPLEIN